MKIKIAVTDACIFIDLYDLDLIASFFSLELEIHTTTAVYSELYAEQQQILKAYQSVGKLVVHNLQEADFLQIYSEPYPKSLSETDKSVLYIANRLNACVLSSDKSVRNCAKNQAILYHGLIWIFDRLVEDKILMPEEAGKKMNLLIKTNFIYQNNKSLIAEMDKRLKVWR